MRGRIRILAVLAFLPRAAAADLTFARDIAPLVYARCAPCHHPGEAAPFSLLTYQDVRRRASQIVAVTHSGFMPPWLPEAGHGDFAHSRRLSPDQVRTIADWVAQGAPEGEHTPPPPDFSSGWQLGKPDLVLQARQPARVPDSGPDFYWNFVFRPALSQTRYVRAIEIRPGNPRITHHANLLVDRTGSAPASDFPGMDVTILRSPFDPDGHFLFWKPGSVPQSEPAGFAWRLDPGNSLVLNTHFHPTGKVEEARPSIALYFTDKPQTRFPVLVQLESDDSLDIPPGDPDFLVSDSFSMPMDADVLAVYPHAHYLGNILEAYATLPSGDRKWLIRIPHWDPNWQAVYDYREPVFLPKDTVVTMRYHYDNSSANPRNPNQPPRRVHAGDQSTDEMAHLWLQVLPRGSADRRRELQEAVMFHRLQKNPADFSANFNLGAILLSRLDATGAIPMLETAVRAAPERAAAHDMYGLALATTGRITEALAEYQTALRLKPDLAAARFNLANALLKSGQAADAIAAYRAVRQSDPQFAEVKPRLARALTAHARQLQSAERWDEAAAECREAIELDPADSTAHAQLGELLLLRSDFTTALDEFNKAIELDPSNIAARDRRDLLMHR